MKTYYSFLKVIMIFALLIPFTSPLIYGQNINSNGSGYALDFDGTNGSTISDYVNCGNSASLNITQSLTIEAWIKPTKTGNQSIIKKYGQNLGAYELFLENAIYGRISFRLNGNETYRVNSTSFYNQPLNTWIHVTGTFDYATKIMKIFVNGKEEASTTGPSSINIASNSMVIGTDLTSFSKSFQGNIDEVRIWNQARPDADIKANMNKKLAGTESGLVGYWRFDETSGTLMNDETSFNNDGTMINMDDPADHVWSGASLGNASVSDYDASGGYIASLSHPDGDGITATTTSGTIYGLQVYRSDDNAFRSGSTVPSGYIADPLRFWGVKVFGISSPKYTLVCNYSGNPEITDESNLILLKRADHSVAAWVDASAALDVNANTLTLTNATGTEYALGIPEIISYQLTVQATTGGTITQPVSPTLMVNNGAHTTITAAIQPGYSFLGWTVVSGSASIANPSLLSTIVTLTSGDAMVRANFGMSLVCHYTMDEESGTILRDSSGNINNGTINGIASWYSGVHSKSLFFNHSSTYAVIPSNSTIDITGPISLSAWISPKAVATQRIVKKVSGAGNGNAGYELFLGSGTNPNPVSFRFNGLTRLDSKTSYPVDGSWMHVTATWDGAIMKMYINGILDDSVNNSSAPLSCTSDMAIGGNSAGGDFFFGRLDDVHIFNYALTQSEVQLLASHNIISTNSTGGTIIPAGVTKVLHKTSQTYTILPDSGYSVIGVTVDNIPQGAISTYTFNGSSDTTDHTIHASFALTSSHLTITAIAGNHGSISPSGNVSVNHGSDQVFIINPSIGYHIEDVLIDSISIGATLTYTFNNVTANHTISASFAINKYTLNITTYGDGDVLQDPDSSMYNYGSVVQLTAAPAIGGWVFEGWHGDTTGTTNPILLPINSNKNITAIFSNPNTLVGNWDMEEGSGTTLIDSSAFNNNGKIIGHPTWHTGIKGNAISFNGTSQYIAVPDNPSLHIWNAITLAVWIAPTKTATQRIITKAVQGSKDGYELSLSIEGHVFIKLNQTQNGGLGWRLQSSTTYPTTGTDWIHVAATYDGATIRMYINGIEESNWSKELTINTNTDSLYIGKQHDPLDPYYYQGKMDELQVYSRALSSSEIRALASHTITATAGSNGSVSPSGSFLVTHNSNAMITINADPGYIVGDLLVDGVSVGAHSNYTLTNVIANHTFHATFILANLPPDTISLLSPINGSSGLSMSPTLKIKSHDPNNDSLTVTFYGKRYMDPGNFTIIELPDAQGYSVSAEGNEIFKAQTQWIVSQRAIRNIVYVNQIGDIVETGDSIQAEWDRAYTSMGFLEDPVTTGLPEGIPYGVCVGNHDQIQNQALSGNTIFYNQYFGSSHFENKSYYGGHFGLNNNNNFQLFDANGMNFIAVNLEYNEIPMPKIYHWADSLLKKYNNRRAIICTHYLMDGGIPGPFSYLGGLIYDSLKDNPNLFLMLGGHTGPDGRRTDIYNGHTVHSLLADYQGRSNGGNGWLRIMEFSPFNNEIHVKTYSPTLNQFETTSNSQFTLSYPMNDYGYEVIGTKIKVPSDSNTSVQWQDLEPNSQYDWYVTVSDGEFTTTSPTYTFTTEPCSLTLDSCSKTDVTCFRENNGSVTAGTVTNNIGNITYTWKNESDVVVGTTSTVNGLPVGIYTLTVTDQCSLVSCNVNISGPNAPIEFTDYYSICQGDTLIWHGQNLDSSGVYTANYVSQSGCDSIYSLSLTVHPAYHFFESHSICRGETYSWHGTDYLLSGIYTANYPTRNGCDSIYSLNLTVNITKTLQIKALLEGLYIGGNMMHEAIDFIPATFEFPMKWGQGIADTLTVALYDDTYLNIIALYHGVNLNTDGNMSISVNSTLVDSYYISIYPRNSVPITTALPQSFAGTSVSYDFTISEDQAYGAAFADPMKDLGDGNFGMYTGELDHDTYYVIDGSDVSVLDPDILVGPYGYLITDLNGDGVVDGSDMSLMDANSLFGPLFWNPTLAK